MTKILKKDGVQIMGEHRLPNPLYTGAHHATFTPPQGLTDQVIKATKEVQRDALRMPYVDDLVDVAEDFPHIAELQRAAQEEYWNDPIFKIEPVNLGNAQEYTANAGIEDDAITQLEADDRFEYTVDEIVDLVPRLRADCECCRDVIESGLLTENVKLLLETHWHICEVELRRLKGARVVV